VNFSQIKQGIQIDLKKGPVEKSQEEQEKAEKEYVKKIKSEILEREKNEKWKKEQQLEMEIESKKKVVSLQKQTKILPSKPEHPTFPYSSQTPI
jgi:hypothetical protein